MVFVFGGETFGRGNYNSLSVLNLDHSKLEFQNLSDKLTVPTARRGHAMEVYNDKLYIFGGVDISGNR
jgi:hypothetical protein